MNMDSSPSELLICILLSVLQLIFNFKNGCVIFMEIFFIYYLFSTVLG